MVSRRPTHHAASNGLVIPNHGHFLCTNTGRRATHSARIRRAATATGGDLRPTFPTTPGLRSSTTTPAAGLLAGQPARRRRLGVGRTPYREGAGYPPITVPSLNDSLERKTVGMCPDALCSTGGFETPVYTSALVDTGDNASDFIFLDTNGTSAGFGQRLGVPGPENTSSPIMVDGSSQLLSLKASGCSARDAAPNRVRDLTSDPVNNSSDGIDLHKLENRRAPSRVCASGSSISRHGHRRPGLRSVPPRPISIHRQLSMQHRSAWLFRARRSNSRRPAKRQQLQRVAIGAQRQREHTARQQHSDHHPLPDRH